MSKSLELVAPMICVPWGQHVREQQIKRLKALTDEVEMAEAMNELEKLGSVQHENSYSERFTTH